MTVLLNKCLVSCGEIFSIRQPHWFQKGCPVRQSRIIWLMEADRCLSYQWKRSNEVLRNDAQHLKRFMWIKYEDLVENTQAILNQITEFLEIENYGAIDSGQTWNIHERNYEIRNMFSVNIDKLSRNDIAVINEVAGDSIESCGYKQL